MSEKKVITNLDDMPEITDFSKGRRMPHIAEQIKKHGYTIRTIEHYSPEDIANGVFDDTKEIAAALIELMSKEETTRLLLYIKENYSLPCSPHVWDVLEQ